MMLGTIAFVKFILDITGVYKSLVILAGMVQFTIYVANSHQYGNKFMPLMEENLYPK